MLTRRSSFAVFAAALLTPVAAALAQSTTAPSNSEGTPQPATGNIGTTRVGPATPAPRATTRHRRRRHHRHHTTTVPVNPQ